MYALHCNGGERQIYGHGRTNARHGGNQTFGGVENNYNYCTGQ